MDGLAGHKEVVVVIVLPFQNYTPSKKFYAVQFLKTNHFQKEDGWVGRS